MGMLAYCFKSLSMEQNRCVTALAGHRAAILFHRDFRRCASDGCEKNVEAIWC